jgi:hypothetical protein
MNEHYPPNPSEPEDLYISTAIRAGLEQAEADGTVIDDQTAMLIATARHRGEDTAMYRLARTGEVRQNPLYEEILAQYDRHASDEDRRQLNALGTYVFDHSAQGEVDGWDNPFMD